MAGGPRKFSEKIALLNQKEAEGNAAFDSIMVEVKAIRPSGSNSGSQLEMLDTEGCLTEKKHSTIEETIGFNESVNITYMSERQQALALQFQLQQHKNQIDQQNLINKNKEQQQSIVGKNSYLQLPNQNDSFRRAHSDSSLNQSVSNSSNSNAQLGVNFQPDQNSYQQQQQTMMHHQQYQQQQQQQLHFQPQFQNQLYQPQPQPQSPQPQQQQQQQQNMYQPSPFIQGTSEYNAIPFRNLSLPISSSLLPLSPTNFGQLSPTSPTTSIKTEPKIKNLSSPTKSNAASPTSALSPTLISPHHIKNVVNQTQNNNQFIYPTNIQQHHQYQQQSFHQQSQINTDNHLLSPTTNPNFLNANIQNTAGGSLPDLTSFQFQQNQSHQMMQLQDYNNKRQQQQQQQQHMQHNEQTYELSPQMLQPNFQQHNHIGPVKPTHSNSVSPVRGASRYSPTHSNSNLNSISNRRSSPQHLGLNKQPLIANTSAQSSPTSPLHPSVQNFPALEFTINNYMPSSPNNNNNNSNNIVSSSNNNIVYRTNSASTCTTQGAESLPPSPQSQHSCFNSPQGSPGPISISPADLNPFTSNNYDIMQKKFDSINLETNNSLKGYLPNGASHVYGQYSPGSALSPTSPTAPNQGLIQGLIPRSPNNPGSNMQHNKILNSKGSAGDLLNNNNNIINNTIDNSNSNSNSNDNLNNLNAPTVPPIINTVISSNDNLKNLEKSAKTINGKIDCINRLDEIGALHKNLINNNTNNFNSNNSGMSNNEIEIDQMYNPLHNAHLHHPQQHQQIQMHHQHHQQQHHHHHHHLQHHNSDISNVIKTIHHPDNNKMVHKNSIPNIIFTFSGDSTDDKNDNILKEMSNDLIYNDDLLMNKNEQFDLDLQMLSDSVENNNHCNGIYQNT